MNAFRHVVAFVALIAGAQTAQAQSPASWTGFYIGVNGGYGWGDRSNSITANDAGSQILIESPFVTTLPRSNFDAKGATGGLQAGYNWQFAPRWVAGFEADFNLADIRGNGSANNIEAVFPPPFPPIPMQVETSERLEWFGTVRGRLGFLVTDDLLLFGTGGFAYGRVQLEATHRPTDVGLQVNVPPYAYVCLRGTICFAGKDTSIETGWTLGGGAEWKLWSRLSLKLDYSYINLGSSSYAIYQTSPAAGTPTSSMKISTGDLDFHFVRAGLNWRF